MKLSVLVAFLILTWQRFFNIVIESVATSATHECFMSLFHKIQNCSNTNILYVTAPMGESSGLGSEFNRYLIYSLLTAVADNRRMGAS